MPSDEHRTFVSGVYRVAAGPAIEDSVLDVRTVDDGVRLAAKIFLIVMDRYNAERRR